MPTNTVVGSARAIFTISLVAAATEEVRVDWTTKDGTAIAGRDYEANSGTVVFAPGETSKTVEVFVNGRTVETEDRVFYVMLAPPVNALLADEIGACIIHVDTTGTTPVVTVIIPRGEKGLTGDSAYQIALNNGFVGTQPEWLASLRPSPEELAPLVAPLINAGAMSVTAEATAALPDTSTIAGFAGRIAYLPTTKKAIAPPLTAGTNVLPMASFVGDTVSPDNFTGFGIVIKRGTALVVLPWQYLPTSNEVKIDSAVAGDVPIALERAIGGGNIALAKVQVGASQKTLLAWLESFIASDADLQVTNDPLKGAAILGRAAVAVASIFDLLSAKRDTSQVAVVASYHPGVYATAAPDSHGGGGNFYWSPAVPKSKHNGGTIISPTVPWDGTKSKLAAFLIGTGETAAGTNGCWVRSADEIDVKMFGAPAQGSLGISDYASFQAAVNWKMSNPLGGKVGVPDGEYLLDNTVSLNRNIDPNLGRVSIVGESMYGTRIIYTGAGDACFQFENRQSGGPGEPNVSHQSIQDMTILGPGKRLNSAGVLVNLAAFFRMERVSIEGFDYASYMQDVDQAYFERVTARFNRKGGFCRKSPTPGAASTQPNNHTYVACTYGSNSDYGAIFVGGSCINFVGGDVEYNGSDATGFGLKFLDCGYEGGRGANIQGTYFEGNTGIADVLLEATTVNTTPLLSIVHQLSADFKRHAGAGNTINHIACLFGPSATVGHQQLVTVGCSFKAYGAYVPSAAKKAIAFGITPANVNNYYDMGSRFDVPLEKPGFVQNLNMVEGLVSRATNQSIPINTVTQWLLDTKFQGNELWAPTFSAGGIVIQDTGTYNLSVFMVFNLVATGTKSIMILKNGNIIGSGEASGGSQICTANVTARLAAGDVIKVNFLQSTTAALEIVGSSSGLTNMSATKIF